MEVLYGKRNTFPTSNYIDSQKRLRQESLQTMVTFLLANELQFARTFPVVDHHEKLKMMSFHAKSEQTCTINLLQYLKSSPRNL